MGPHRLVSCLKNPHPPKKTHKNTEKHSRNRSAALVFFRVPSSGGFLTPTRSFTFRSFLERPPCGSSFRQRATDFGSWLHVLLCLTHNGGRGEISGFWFAKQVSMEKAKGLPRKRFSSWRCWPVWCGKGGRSLKSGSRNSLRTRSKGWVKGHRSTEPLAQNAAR